MKFNWVNHNWVEVGSDLSDSPGTGGVFQSRFVENSLGVRVPQGKIVNRSSRASIYASAKKTTTLAT
jgi:hypothetical protein